MPTTLKAPSDTHPRSLRTKFNKLFPSYYTHTHVNAIQVHIYRDNKLQEPEGEKPKYMRFTKLE